MKNYIAPILFIIFLLCGCSLPPAPATETSPLDGMSLEQKVGQLFFVRCPEPQLTTSLLQRQPGGLVLFKRDFAQRTKDEVRQTLESYQQKSKIPLLFGVDEEGGNVVRISSNPLLRAEKFRSPQQLFQAGGMDAIRRDTAEKSKLLLELGIHMNLAPVADVSTSPKDFMYERSFGGSASETADYVAVVVREMKTHGIASCLKHFPGYGSNNDTHTGAAVDPRPYEQFVSSDFLPFSAGIQAGADAVLVSHNIIESMDASLPASLSRPVHDILRGELHFSGLILTDDLAMKALNAYKDPYVKAVLAGNDLLIVSDFDTAYEQVLSAVKDGTIPMQILDTAVTRTLEWKKAHLPQ